MLQSVGLQRVRLDRATEQQKMVIVILGLSPYYERVLALSLSILWKRKPIVQ